MNNKKLISIIIPVYNRQNFVEDTLNNLLENNYRPLELILVDDGSTDNSLKILNEFKDKYKDELFNIKVFSQKNQGAPVARNLGLSESKGEFIQFLDSDDLIHQDKFVIQLNLMQQDNSEFGLCDFRIIYTKTNKELYISNSDKLKKVIKTHGSFGCGSPLLARSLSDKVEWNESLKRNQDIDYFLKCALLANRIVYVNEPLYTYVRHDEERISSCYSNTDPVYKTRIKSLKKILKYKYNWYYIFKALINLHLSNIKFFLKKISEK